MPRTMHTYVYAYHYREPFEERARVATGTISTSSFGEAFRMLNQSIEDDWRHIEQGSVEIVSLVKV